MRVRFDQFAKQMTQAALGTAGTVRTDQAGTVRTDQEVSPDAGHVDIWFTPSSPMAIESLAVPGS